MPSSYQQPTSQRELPTAQRRMVERDLAGRDITSPQVLEAMAKVPRDQFVGPLNVPAAFDDSALGIDCGQTISQPYMVALMTQLLELTGAQRVLEIGTGSGYQTAVLAELAKEVVSIERHRDLSAQAAEVLHRLRYGNVTLRIADGTLGAADLAPFDRIIVTAAAADVPPELTQQLSDGGILVIPLGPPSSQVLTVVRKHAQGIDREMTIGCRFVPLISEEPGGG